MIPTFNSVFRVSINPSLRSLEKDFPEISHQYLDSSKMIKLTGWKPKTNFKQGIKLTFDWYNKNKSYYESLSKKDIIKRQGKG